ncbi:MAG TPA: ATP synthase F1 subunit delta [Bryobacteraceae bacterium]|jgi:F-type H+-transporting ATPase subunit delta|nr:ATP synthase F1 subunit delta [Bryobacteraceae bacterium]
MTDALSKHYAEALANAVLAPNSGLPAEQAKEQMRTAARTVTSSDELTRALLSPAVNKTHKQAVIGKLADALGLHRLIKNFLLVVISHRRTRELNAMAREFELAVDERTGWIPAEIETARELTPEQRQQIEKALGEKLGKFIRADYRVNPALIGGIRAHVASRQYDASVRGKLEGMRSRLLAQL